MRLIDVIEEQKEAIDVEYFNVASEFQAPQKWSLHELAELLTNPPRLCEDCDNSCQSRYLFGRNCACVRQLFNNAEELEAYNLLLQRYQLYLTDLVERTNRFCS